MTAKYTRRERVAILTSCMLGFALDFYDILIMPFVMPSIQKDLGLSLTEIGSITSVTLIGSVIGGALFGWLGDKIGRKQALQLTLFLFAAGSVASAFAWNYPSLAVLRFLTGVGLGGEWGAGMVLFNETWNKDRRGIGSAFIQGSAVLSSAVASIVGIWATTTFSLEWGWRVALLTGGAPIVLMIFIRFFMPESREWERFDQARKTGSVVGAVQTSNTFGLLFRAPLLPVTLLSLIWLSSYMFSYFAIAIFMPTLMLKTMNVPPEVVRNITVVTSVMSGLSYLSVGLLNDALGRRWGALIPCIFWIAMTVGLTLYGKATYGGDLLSFPGFYIFAAFMIGHSSLAVAGPWLSELFPTAVRSTALSVVYMAGRGAGSFAPVAVPMLAAHLGGDLGQSLLIVIPTIALFLVASVLLPETRKRSETNAGAAYSTV